MFTIPELVKEIVMSSPYLEEALSSRIINLSALARRIKPELEENTLKKVSVSAIIVALQRLGTKLQKKQKAAKIALPDDITVRSNLVELTYVNSPNLRKKQLKALTLAEQSKDVFFNTLQGIFETSIITSQQLAKDLEKLFKGEKQIFKFENLSSITLRFSEEAVYTPGVYYLILKNLAWDGINVVEVISIHNEMSIIVESDKLDQAFLAIKRLK